MKARDELKDLHKMAYDNIPLKDTRYRVIDEHLQALEIIVKKEVNLTTFYYSTGSVETYNELIEIHIKPSAYEKCKLTQEEYDLVSKVVKEIMEDERR